MLRAMKLPFDKAVCLATGLCCLANVAFAQRGQGPSPVVAAHVKQQSVTSTQAFVGTVMPSQRATIGSAVDGRIVQCDFEEGDRVEAGGPLAQLLTETISLEIVSAKGELRYLQAKLQELENGTRAEQLEQARAKMAAAKARLDYREERRERLRDVAEQTSAVSEDEWREALMAAAEAKEVHAEAQAAYEEAKAGPRQELIAQAKAQVDMQQAVVHRLEDQLSKHTIRSRFTGYVVTKSTEEGQWVNRGDAVAEVVGIDVVEVVVHVLEQSVPYISPGAEVSVDIPALPQSPFSAKVITVVPQGDVRARTFPVKIAIQNQTTAAGPLIKPGMYARVELPVGETTQATLVPKDAVVLGQGSATVYVVDGANGAGQSGTAMPVPVKLGSAYGEWIDIGNAIAPGALVVVEGNERLVPNADVQVSRIVESLSQRSAIPGR